MTESLVEALLTAWPTLLIMYLLCWSASAIVAIWSSNVGVQSSQEAIVCYLGGAVLGAVAVWATTDPDRSRYELQDDAHHGEEDPVDPK